jgi:hypothetical protein
MKLICMQNSRKTCLSLTNELCPIRDNEAMTNALKKVRFQHSDATLDDAKNYYITLLLDKKLDPIHGHGQIKLTRNKKQISKQYSPNDTYSSLD